MKKDLSLSELAINKGKKKILGVAAGISDWVGIDVTIIRIALLLLAWQTDAWLVVIAYLILALVLPNQPTKPSESVADVVEIIPASDDDHVVFFDVD